LGDYSFLSCCYFQFYQSKNECGRTQEQVEDSLYMHMLFKNTEELNCNKNNFISEINDIYKLNVQNENEDIFSQNICSEPSHGKNDKSYSQ
jgi:hypothetical protein